MKKSARRQQLLRAIQEYVTQEGMTAADVHRLVVKAKGDVSISSVQRIMTADVETANFTLDVLRGVSKALFEVNDKPMAEEITSPDEAEKEALRAVAALSEAELKEAQQKISEFEKQQAESVKKIEQLTELVAFLKQQAAEKDKQIERLWGLISK